jgi:hypothetical protein
VWRRALQAEIAAPPPLVLSPAESHYGQRILHGFLRQPGRLRRRAFVVKLTRLFQFSQKKRRKKNFLLFSSV